MSESAISAKSARRIFANFVKFVKPIFGTTRRSEGSVMEAEYPTNYQRISNLSLTIRPFRVAILAVLLVFVGSWNSEVWGAWSGSGEGTLENGVWYVLYQTFDKFHSRNCFFYVDVILVAVVVECNGIGFGIVTINSFCCDDRPAKIATDIISNCFGIGKGRLGIYVKSFVMNFVHLSLDFFEGGTDAGL